MQVLAAGLASEDSRESELSQPEAEDETEERAEMENGNAEPAPAQQRSSPRRVQESVQLQTAEVNAVRREPLKASITAPPGQTSKSVA